MTYHAPLRETAQSVGLGRRLGGPAFVSFAGSMFTLVVGGSLQLYVVRVLGASGVGAFGILEAVTATVVGLMGLGIGQVPLRFIPAYIQHGERGFATGLIRLGLKLLLALGTAGYVLLFLGAGHFGSWSPQLTSYRDELRLMGLAVPLALVAFFLQQCLRGFQAIGQIVLGSSVIQLAVKALLTVIAFTVGWRLDGYIAAYLGGLVCGICWLGAAVARNVRALRPTRTVQYQYREWRRYAVTCYIPFIVGAATIGLDRFVVGAFFGAGAVGILVIVQLLERMSERFNQMLLAAGSPMLAAAHHRNDRDERQQLFHLATGWAVSAALPFLLFLFWFAPAVLGLFGSEFAATGTTPLRILIAGRLFNLANGPVGAVGMMSGLERECLKRSVSATALSVGLVAILASRYGVTGAAIAGAAHLVVLNLMVMALVRRRLGLLWWNRRYLAWLWQGAAAALVAVASEIVVSPGTVWGLAAVLAATYGAAAAVTLAGGLQEDDRDFIRSIGGHRAARAVARVNEYFGRAV